MTVMTENSCRSKGAAGPYIMFVHVFDSTSGLVAFLRVIHALGFRGHAAGAVQRQQVPYLYWKHHHQR